MDLTGVIRHAVWICLFPGIQFSLAAFGNRRPIILDGYEITSAERCPCLLAVCIEKCVLEAARSAEDPMSMFFDKRACALPIFKGAAILLKLTAA